MVRTSVKTSWPSRMMQSARAYPDGREWAAEVTIPVTVQVFGKWVHHADVIVRRRSSTKRLAMMQLHAEVIRIHASKTMSVLEGHEMRVLT